MAVMRAASLTDEQKEAALQANAIALFKSFFTLSAGLAVAALLPATVLWLCDRLGWLSFDRVLAVSFSPAFLIAGGAVVIATLLLGGRPATPDAESYSGVDRALHRVAFATYEVQADLADIEDRLFASHLGSITNQRPVFITSLPRAGTTLLLECCAALDEFASHTYRDMPFVMIPCLWSSFSGAFRREGQLKPRAHGDGMQIDFDSPEALEEVLWLKFWEKQYLADRILPWPSRPRQEFTTFFARHMRKIAFVRRGDRARRCPVHLEEQPEHRPNPAGAPDVPGRHHRRAGARAARPLLVTAPAAPAVFGASRPRCLRLTLHARHRPLRLRRAPPSGGLRSVVRRAVPRKTRSCSPSGSSTGWRHINTC